MTKTRVSHLSLLYLLAGFFALLGTAAAVFPARANTPVEQGTDEYCLSCHGDPQRVSALTLPSGETLPLLVTGEMLDQSVHHAQGIECRACHSDIQEYPHPQLEYRSHRELSRAYYLACQKCHPANYEKTLDSIHARVAEGGNLNAPICTDCHSAHTVKDPGQPRSQISETCRQCHGEVVDQYVQSVHGAALLEDNPDVPVCTDCHGVHNIQDPRSEQFKVQSPELCAGCHANATLMSKYDLPANVYDIYKLSWHGVDLAVYKARWPTIWHDTAVCTDCHGTHDIRKSEDPQSKVNPAHLLATCQKCHPGAGPNWTGAWTGHNEVSLERTPFVFYTQAFYESFMPAVLWVAAIYVGLQILRASVERVRRNLP